MIVLTAPWIRNNLLKFIRNYIQLVKLMLIASKIVKFIKRKFSLHLLFLRYAFDAFDKNNDKNITFDEFLLAVAASGQGDLDERLDIAFDM